MDGVISFKPCSAFYIFAELPVDDVEKFIIWLLTGLNIKIKRYHLRKVDFTLGITRAEKKEDFRFVHII